MVWFDRVVSHSIPDRKIIVTCRLRAVSPQVSLLKYSAQMSVLLFEVQMMERSKRCQNVPICVFEYVFCFGFSYAFVAYLNMFLYCMLREV